MAYYGIISLIPKGETIMKIAIVGAGIQGVSIVEALLSAGHEITLIEKDEATAQRIAGLYDIQTVIANSKELNVLKEIHIESFDLLICCTGEDEKNLVIGKFAKYLGCKQVIVRVRDPEHAEQVAMLKNIFGIDHVVNPDMACATEIYKYLTDKYSFGGGRFEKDGVAIIQFDISVIPELIDKEVRDAGSVLGTLLIGAVSRNGKIIVPGGSTKLLEGDKIYVISDDATIAKLSHKISKNKKDLQSLDRVMIAGGGKTGFFLAQKLVKADVAVKIIERDRNRCEYLSARLDDALILHGDATDENLLKEEGFASMDAFVATTSFDEENLLLSLLATQNNIKDVVAKVSRKNYGAITENLGVNMTINPIDMCTANILRFLTNKDSVIFSKIIQGQAEFIEVAADNSMPFTGKTLADAHIPAGILIAAIHRGKDVIIPTGHTVINAGDRVILLSLLSKTAELEGLISGAQQNRL